MAQPQTQVLIANFYISLAVGLLSYVIPLMAIALDYIKPTDNFFFLVEALASPFSAGFIFFATAFVLTFWLNTPRKPFWAYGQSRRARQ